VHRGAGLVGNVEVTWVIINSTTDAQPQSTGHHQFVLSTGRVIFNASQTYTNLSVAIVNDATPSLDTSYLLRLTNVSQVTLVVCGPNELHCLAAA